MRYFDDVRVGYREESAEFMVVGEEMLAYAKEYDPFPIHTDHEYAAGTPFGGLIAPLGYVVSLFFRAVHTLPSNQGPLSQSLLGGLQWQARFATPCDQASVCRADAACTCPTKRPDLRDFVSSGGGIRTRDLRGYARPLGGRIDADLQGFCDFALARLRSNLLIVVPGSVFAGVSRRRCRPLGRQARYRRGRRVCRR
jgi:hypothetical protein